MFSEETRLLDRGNGLKMERPIGGIRETTFDQVYGNGQSSSRLTLTWKDVCVWGSRKRNFLPWKKAPEKTQILKNVSGIAKGGQLIAIMGASGAGKTTLLATISQRIKDHNSGEIRINGVPLERDLLRKISGFVPQQDLAVESLTVKEHMEFMSRLKVSNYMRSSERARWVKSLLSELNLLKCEDTKLCALSGGEKKRLSLAVQLLTDPLMLFCDEPTTGLDSYSATVVIEKLRTLSERGMAIVCTIHQPTSGIFDLFHELILMASGRVAYQGEVAAANQYFSSKGLRCPATYSAAEFYVTQLAICPGKEERCTRQVGWLCDEFPISPEGRALEKAIDESECGGARLYSDQWGDLFGEYICNRAEDKPSRLKQLYWIMWRSMVAARSDKSDSILRLTFFMFVGLVISVPFVGTEKNQRGIQNMQGLFYLIVVETIFTFGYSVFNTFPQEIPTLLREIGDNLYQPGPYYISKMIELIPRCILGPFLYTLLIFCVVGLNGGVLGFLALCVPVMMCAASATAYGCMMSALFSSVSTASLLSVPIDLVTISFSGMFLQLNSLPVYLSWLKYVSQFYYSNEAVSILQWQQVTDLDCWEDIPEAPCLHNGDEVLKNYGFSTSNLTLDLLGLSAIYCVAHVIGFLALLRRSKARAVY